LAEEVQIRNTDGMAKIRSPWFVAIVGLLTLGIYVLFWWYYINREMVDYGRSRGTDELGDNPGLSVLALFPGGFIIVPAILTTINTFKRIQKSQELSGQGEPINGWLGLVLYLVLAPALWAYMQTGLNKVWEIEQGGGQAALPPQQAPAAEQAPQQEEAS
jgi:Domain of unknown function (DUF4234)